MRPGYPLLFDVAAATRRRFSGLELKLKLPRCTGELRLTRGGQRHGFRALGHGQWVLVPAFHAELEMQVRAGRPPGGADRADAHALIDVLAFLDIDAAQVTVQ